jgi:hypothetical protein
LSFLAGKTFKIPPIFPVINRKKRKLLPFMVVMQS